jgi:hypothetical protein
MHRMQPQRRMTGDFETSYGLDEIQGTFFEIPSSEVAAAAAGTAMATAEGHGGEQDEVSGGVEEDVREEGDAEEDEDEDERMERAPNADNDNDYNDPEAWRRRIDLRAVECCEAGVQLATPPFPFYQRWDLHNQDLRDQARRERKKREKKERKKRKRAEESGRAEKKRRASPDYTIGGSAWRQVR